MIKFTIEVQSGHDAMLFNMESELSRMLQIVRERIMNGATEGRMADSNGNNVGKFKIEDVPYIPA